MTNAAHVIVYDGQEFEAEQCERCGGIVYPPEALEPHIERHLAKDAYFKRQLMNPLIQKIKTSRL